jgi:hypothetical protein
MLVRTAREFRPTRMSFVIIDQKRVDFAFAGQIPHLLFPVVRSAEDEEKAYDFLSKESLSTGCVSSKRRTAELKCNTSLSSWTISAL